jgi:hypothetical protein
MLERNHHLTEANLALLEQGRRLLASIDDDIYTKRLSLLFSNRIGAQMRHILEFYECFLDGLPLAHVDYDARRRDELLETSRATAIGRIESIADRLASSSVTGEDGLLWVRMEDTPAELAGDAFLTSSVTRELQVLKSQTIHHFALIAVALRVQGLTADEGFGVAPSTLRHQMRAA